MNDLNTTRTVAELAEALRCKCYPAHYVETEAGATLLAQEKEIASLLSQRDAAVKRASELEEALKKIKKLRAEPIGSTGFQTGPRALFDAAQRIARSALTTGGE